MPTRAFAPRQFLRHVYGTEPFAAFCSERGIPFDQPFAKRFSRDVERRWRDALRTLSDADQAIIELELAQVHDLSYADAVALLVAAAPDGDLPPDSLAGDAAVSLWFYLRHPDLFRETHLRLQVEDVDAWRVASAPAGIDVADADRWRASLVESLREFCRTHDGTGRYCAVECHTLGERLCVVAHLSDRLRLLDVFSNAGQHRAQPSLPAVPILFVYDPADGQLLIRSRHRAAEKVLALVRCFGRTVLGTELPRDCLAPPFRLDALKRRWDFAADAADMERVRLKALHLAYPERDARRRVKLETFAGDDPSAIASLLGLHGGHHSAFDDLDIVYAELEVSLRTGGRLKPHVIRLWPDRSNLSQSALGDRFRSCLRRWGVLHAA